MFNNSTFTPDWPDYSWRFPCLPSWRRLCNLLGLSKSIFTSLFKFSINEEVKARGENDILPGTIIFALNRDPSLKRERRGEESSLTLQARTKNKNIF